MVMPGSESLRLVHSGVWTGILALASVTSWSKLRSSRTGMGMVTAGAPCSQADVFRSTVIVSRSWLLVAMSV